MQGQVQTSQPRPSDKWIPWYFFAFFTVLVLVLVPMCVIAVRTNSGVVTENAYEKGLAYNKTIDAAQQLASLGWGSDVTAAITTPGYATVTFKLHDGKGAPIANATAKASLFRITQSGMDQSADMTPGDKGTYTAVLDLPAPGLWEVRVAAHANGYDYQTAKRIVLK